MPKQKITSKKINDREKLWNIKRDFLGKMESLRKKQDKIIQDYLKFLEQKKVTEVKKRIKEIK